MADKDSMNRMSEEDLYNSGVVEKQDSLASSSTRNLVVGRRVPGFLAPTVEALVLGRKIREDGSTDVSLLVAPHFKKGSWFNAAVCIRSEQKVSQRQIDRYKYPLPWAHKLSLELARNKADTAWLRDTIADINNYIVEGGNDNHTSEVELVAETKGRRELPGHLEDSVVEESYNSEKGISSRALPKSSISSSRQLRRSTRLKKWTSSSAESTSTDRRKFGRRRKEKKKRGIWPNSPRSRKAAARAIQSSSSNSTDSRFGDRYKHDEVGFSEEEDDGYVDCPFSKKDIRRYINVKKVIKGKAIERRYIRQALHNLYRHYTSLQTFVDSIQARAVTGPSQPYPSELI